MQLKINFIFPPGTELPINYQHIQQGIIFKALKDNPEYSDYMHDVGFGSEKRKYKAFVFSPFLGKYTIQNKRISFSGDIEFEIRSVDNRFIQALYCGIEKEGIKLGETRIIPEEIYVLDEEIETETVIVRMVSPLTLYTTEENGFTHYYAPNEPGFISFPEKESILIFCIRRVWEAGILRALECFAYISRVNVDLAAKKYEYNLENVVNLFYVGISTF